MSGKNLESNIILVNPIWQIGEVIMPPTDNLKCPFRYFCFPKGLLYIVPQGDSTKFLISLSLPKTLPDFTGSSLSMQISFFSYRAFCNPSIPTLDFLKVEVWISQSCPTLWDPVDCGFQQKEGPSSSHDLEGRVKTKLIIEHPLGFPLSFLTPWASVPWLERCPGEGNGNPPQYSWLGNPMDRGTWWAALHGVTKSGINLATKQLQRSPLTFHRTPFINLL